MFTNNVQLDTENPVALKKFLMWVVGDNNVDLIGDTVAADNYLSSTIIASVTAR